MIKMEILWELSNVAKKCECVPYPNSSTIKRCDLGCYHSFCDKCKGQLV